MPEYLIEYGWDMLFVGLFVFVGSRIAIWLFDDDDDVEDDALDD